VSENSPSRPLAAATDALFLAVDAIQSGRWAEADQAIADGARSCRADGHLPFAQNFCYLDGVLAAGHGDHDGAREKAAALIRWSAPRRARLMELWAAHIRALDAIGRSDYEEAYQNAAAISAPGTFPAYAVTAVWTGLDLVEAAMRTGRGAQAAAHAAAMREAALAARSPRLDFVAAACAATAASSMRSTGLFEAVLARPTARQWPFDLARVQLAYGEQLRRGHAAAAGRVQLAAARATFEQLGARPWAARADAELRATGPNRDEVVTTVLTTQEYEIAALAAAGLTNKQIGEQLFLSHRTVSTHLYRTFPKLGIRTRAALRDALATVPPPARDARLSNQAV